MEAARLVYNEATDPTHIQVDVPESLAVGPVMVKVRNADLQESNATDFTVMAGFIRGDANLDGFLDLSDAIKVLLVFAAGSPTTCRDALDADDSGLVDTTDA